MTAIVFVTLRDTIFVNVPTPVHTEQIMNDKFFSLIQFLLIGILPFVAAILGFMTSYWIEKRKSKTQIKLYPSQIVYEKQTEFFDRVGPMFRDLNNYISTIHIYLTEGKEIEYKDEFEKHKSNTESIDKISNLIQKYYLYLPVVLFHEFGTMLQSCYLLSEITDLKYAEKAIKNFYYIQNKIREYIGIESISEDLLTAFGSRKHK